MQKFIATKENKNIEIGVQKSQFEGLYVFFIRDGRKWESSKSVHITRKELANLSKIINKELEL